MLFILVSFGQNSRQLEHAEGPIEFGRGPEHLGVPRVSLPDPRALRDHLRAEEMPGELIRLENLSKRTPIDLDDGRQLPVGGTLEVALPVRATLGGTAITVTAHSGATVEPARPIPRVLSDTAEGLLTIAPPVGRPGPGTLVPGVPEWTGSMIFSASELGESPTADTLVRWMEMVQALQRRPPTRRIFLGRRHKQ